MKSSIFSLPAAFFAFSCQENSEPINWFLQTWNIAGWESNGFRGIQVFRILEFWVDSGWSVSPGKKVKSYQI